MANLSLEKRTFLNESNVNEYNISLSNMNELAVNNNINFHMFDTTNITQRKISIDIANIILDDMRTTEIKRITKELKKLK